MGRYHTVVYMTYHSDKLTCAHERGSFPKNTLVTKKL